MELKAELTPGRLGCDCDDHEVVVDGGGMHFTMTPHGQSKERLPVEYYAYLPADVEAARKWHDSQLKLAVE